MISTPAEHCLPATIRITATYFDNAGAFLCRDFKGDEVRSPTDQAALLRLYTTAFPKRGGLSTSEMQIPLPRFVRQ